MGDPFDDVTPVGRRDEPPLSQASTNRIRDVRREVRRATQAGRAGEPNARTNRATLPGSRGSSRRRATSRGGVLSFAQLEKMASHIAEIAYADVQSEMRSGDRKHAATTFAIVTDKLLLLRGRPTEILAVTDELRPAAHDIAGKLSLIRGRRSA